MRLECCYEDSIFFLVIFNFSHCLKLINNIFLIFEVK